MTGWYILSTITFLPLVGALFILAIRGDDEVARRNMRATRCRRLINCCRVVFPGIWTGSTRRSAGFQLEDRVTWLGV